MNKAARNERRRISATAANNVGVACFVTGIVVPLASLTYPLAYAATRYWFAFAILWLLVAVGLHLVSRWILKGIEE